MADVAGAPAAPHRSPKPTRTAPCRLPRRRSTWSSDADVLARSCLKKADKEEEPSHGTGSTWDKFDHILEQLAQEHRREVSALRTRLAITAAAAAAKCVALESESPSKRCSSSAQSAVHESAEGPNLLPTRQIGAERQASKESNASGKRTKQISSERQVSDEKKGREALASVVLENEELCRGVHHLEEYDHGNARPGRDDAGMSRGIRYAEESRGSAQSSRGHTVIFGPTESELSTSPHAMPGNRGTSTVSFGFFRNSATNEEIQLQAAPDGCWSTSTDEYRELFRPGRSTKSVMDSRFTSFSSGHSSAHSSSMHDRPNYGPGYCPVGGMRRATQGGADMCIPPNHLAATRRGIRLNNSKHFNSQASLVYAQMEHEEQSRMLMFGFRSLTCGVKSAVAIFKAWALYTKEMRAKINFEVLCEWTNEQESINEKGKIGDLNRTAYMSHELGGSSDNLQCGEETKLVLEKANGCCSPLIISPNSQFRIIWDVVGAFLLFYDICMIPMQPFDVPQNIIVDMMDWVTTIFWSGDMFASCVTGYLDKGAIVMVPTKILRQYVRGWFWLDIAVMGPEWVFTVSSLLGTSQDENGGAGAGKIMRALRVIRVARLLRLAKLKRVLTMAKDRIDSEVTFIVLNIVKLIILTLMVNHFLGSVWYTIGLLSKESGEPNWIEYHGFEDRSILYRYFTAMHWSLTQFTPGSMHVQPQCAGERFYAVATLVFGLVLFSSIVGNITASIGQLKQMSEEKSKQLWLLRRYLRQRGVNPALFYRVIRHVEYSLSEQKDLVGESRLWVLDLLTRPLRNELNFEVSYSSLRRHGLFPRAAELSAAIMPRLASYALSTQNLAPGDPLLCAGTSTSLMHIVVTGTLQYYKLEDDIMDDCSDWMKDGDWASEAALWTKWIHVGTVRTSKESHLVQIDALKFSEVIRKEVSIVCKLVRGYAQKYVQWLNDTPRGDLSDISHFEEAATLVEKLLPDAYSCNVVKARSNKKGSSSWYPGAEIELSHAPSLSNISQNMWLQRAGTKKNSGLKERSREFLHKLNKLRGRAENIPKVQPHTSEDSGSSRDRQVNQQQFDSICTSDESQNGCDSQSIAGLARGGGPHA